METVEIIEELMDRKGWTKYKLAKESGLPQSTITSLFSDRVKNPSTDSLVKIANALGVEVSILINKTDPVNSKEKGFGTYLKSLRVQRKMSLRDVAEISELSHTYIADLENGKRRETHTDIKPSVETLRSLAEAYKIPHEQLMIAAGYLGKEWARRDVSSRIVYELITCQVENANLKAQVKQLKDVISILLKDGDHHG